MSLNNISLPSQLVADLYQNTLVSATATAMPVKKPEQQPLSFLGKNGRNILIVVNKPNIPYLPDEELAFLTKVLSACQLGLLDVAIVNWNRLANPDASLLQEETNAQSVILFDVEPSQFGLAGVPMFAVQQANNRQFVAAPALNEIEKSKEAKGQLWGALKQLFCI